MNTLTIPIELELTPRSKAVMDALYNAISPQFQAPQIKKSIPVDLASGERYAGLLLDDEGNPSHHLILLPGDADDLTWTAAKAWAEEQGGELPTRREQSLLFANLKSEFQSTWYWSSEPQGDASAWLQNFGNGLQFNLTQDGELRARAVRRLSV